MHSSGFVEDLALTVGIAGLTGLLFRLLRQPSVLGYLLAGLIVGPYLPTPLYADPERVHALSEFGVIFVMFAVGLEFRIARVLQVLPVSGVTGLIQIGTLLWMGLAVGRFLLGWGDTESLFLGASICISSTMVVSKILEQDPVDGETRRFILGILVLQDVAAIALITVMATLGRGEDATVGSVLGVLGKLSLVLASLVALGMFVVPRFVRALVKSGSNEALVVGAIGLCFGCALLAQKLGYSVALGAFVGGVLVAEGGEGPRVEHAIVPVRDLFAAIFFVSIGMSVDPKVALANYPTAVWVFLAVIVGQLLSVSFGGILSGVGLKRSVTSGLALGQVGEFGFILAGVGISARVVRPELQAVLVTVAIATTFSTGFLLRRREAFAHFFEGLLPPRFSRLLSLYEVWFEKLRERPAGERTPFARAVRALVIDVLGLAAFLIVYRLWSPALGHFFAVKLSAPGSWEKWLAPVAMTLASLPFLSGLILSTRHLARHGAERMLVREGGADARDFLRSSITLVALLCMVVPMLLLVTELFGFFVAGPMFLGAVLVAGAVVYRKAGQLDEAMEAGTFRVIQTIAAQGAPEIGSTHLVEDVLKGFGEPRAVTLREGAYAVGKNLRLLRLRSTVGVNAVARRSAQGEVVLPSGEDLLGSGDTLFLIGTIEACELSDRYLNDGPEAIEPGFAGE